MADDMDKVDDFDEQAALARLRRLPPTQVASFIWREIYGEDVNLTSPDWLQIWREARGPFEMRFGSDPARSVQLQFEAIQQTDPMCFDARLAEDASVVFILGAGASAPDPSNLPTNADLLPQLWERARKLGREDLLALERWCEEQRIVDIEDLLTAAYIANFSSRSRGVLSLLDYFLFRQNRESAERSRPRPRLEPAGLALLQDTLQTVFGLLLGRMLHAQPNAAHEAIAKLAQETGRVGVITTNYDACIDLAYAKANLDPALPLPAAGDGSRTDLIKMHGSINWSYCESCQDAHVAPLDELRRAFEHDTLGYAVISICKACGGQRRPMVVPPMSFKFVQFPPLLGLWRRAETLLENAAIIVPVGYSFSDADTYIAKMTLKAMGNDRNKLLIIVDQNPEVPQLLRRQLSAVIGDDLDPKRVLRSIESCDVIVPQLIDALNGLPPGTATRDGNQPEEVPIGGVPATNSFRLAGSVYTLLRPNSGTLAPWLTAAAGSTAGTSAPGVTSPNPSRRRFAVGGPSHCREAVSGWLASPRPPPARRPSFPVPLRRRRGPAPPSTRALRDVAGLLVAKASPATVGAGGAEGYTGRRAGVAQW